MDLAGTKVVVLSADNMTPGATSTEFGPATTLFERFLWSLLDGDQEHYRRQLAEAPTRPPSTAPSRAWAGRSWFGSTRMGAARCRLRRRAAVVHAGNRMSIHARSGDLCGAIRSWIINGPSARGAAPVGLVFRPERPCRSRPAGAQVASMRRP